ncbi:MAG: type II/IV secretion system ATPase subunit [Candidatus Woesearchaeota archaeon]|nr:MAG: type II/IV secretion system ATPase subunit [Candidatus Woesearchaeota archaeon]
MRFFNQKENKSVVKQVNEEKTLFNINLKPKIPKLPSFTDPTQVDVRYPLIEPYVNAHIHWDAQNDEILYEIEEPALTDAERKVLQILEEGIKELINISFIGVKSEDVVIEYLEKNMRLLLSELDIKVSDESFVKFMYYIYRDFVGLNQIEPLMKDYFIEDIECNGSKTPLYLVHRKYRNLKTNIVFSDNKTLGNFVEKLAQKCGKYISYANPVLDGRLPDKSRVNATYTEEISSRGPTFTIRKFTKEPWTPIHLIAFGTASPELLAYLWLLLEYESNVMVIGGTGSGKTTFLNSLAYFIPPQARIVSIEDTSELNLLHENWLPSVARAGFGIASITGERHGEVSLFTLLKESFRQRPDYVIVGEVRGEEANVLFQGMSSGHPSMGTMHAEDVKTMVKRLETPPISLSPSLVEAMDAVVIITQTKVKGKPVRRIREVSEVMQVGDEGQVKENIPFKWDPSTDRIKFVAGSKVFGKIMLYQGINQEKLTKEFRNRAILLTKMYQQQIFDINKVQEIINQYYKTPDKVLKKFGII